MESIDLEKDVLSEMIALYKSYKMLWDTSDASYFNKDARNQAFASLVDVYKRLKPGATVKDVKKKLENMRNTYRKELKKVKESYVTGSGSKEQYVPNLWYYELMLFLDEKEMVRPGAETVEEEDELNTIMNNTEQDNDPDNPTPVDNTTATSATPRPTTLPTDPLSTPASRSVLLNAPSTNEAIPQKKTKISLKKKQDALIDCAQALLQNTGNQFETFGTNVGQQLEMLKPDQQIIAQKLFSDVLFLGKLGKLTPTASVIPTAPPTLPVYCQPSTAPYHLSYSQPYESASSFSDHTASPMSYYGSSSSRTTPSPSSRIIQSVTQVQHSKPPHAPVNNDGQNISQTNQQLSEYFLLH